MMLRIIQRLSSLEVTQSSSKFPRRQTSGAKGAMGNTQRRSVFMSFRLGKELRGCVPLLGDFTANIVGCPYSIEDGRFLRGSVKSSMSVFARNRVSLVSGAA
jgi:hypothetical protein